MSVGSAVRASVAWRRPILPKAMTRRFRFRHIEAMTDPCRHQLQSGPAGQCRGRSAFRRRCDQRAAIARWSRRAVAGAAGGHRSRSARLSPTRFGLDLRPGRRCRPGLCRDPGAGAGPYRPATSPGNCTLPAPVRRKCPNQIGAELVLDRRRGRGAGGDRQPALRPGRRPCWRNLSLALDPYPRCPGVEFAAARRRHAGPESPFAVLKGLKSGL